MTRFVPLLQEIKTQQTAIQTSLEKTHQTLTHLQDRTQLSTDILRELKVTDGEYFTSVKVFEKNRQLIAIGNAVNILNKKIVESREEITKLNEKIEKLAVEAKKEPADTVALHAIQNALHRLLTPPNHTVPESKGLELDALLDSVTGQLSNAAFRARFAKLIKSETGSFLALESLEHASRSSILRRVKVTTHYFAVLSSEGIKLREAVLAEQELQKNLELAKTDMMKQQAVLQVLDAPVASLEKCFANEKQSIIQRLTENINAAEEVEQKILEAEKSVEEIQEQVDAIQNISVRYIGLGEDASVDEMKNLASQMMLLFSEMNSENVNVKAHLIKTALMASELVIATNNPVVERKALNGKAKKWSDFSKKIREQITQCNELVKTHNDSLAFLREQKSMLDQRIVKKIAEQAQLDEKKTPAASIAEPLNQNHLRVVSEEEQEDFEHYRRETQKYLQDLSDSILAHLIAFKKTAKKEARKNGIANRYLFIFDAFKSPQSKKPLALSTVLIKLKELCASHDSLQDIDNKLTQSGQMSLKHTLHKYRLMTQLMAVNSSQQFLDTLRMPENRSILAERRDSSLMVWARSCGPKVSAIVIPVVEKMDALRYKFFSPRGVSYVEELVGPEENIRQNVSPSGP